MDDRSDVLSTYRHLRLAMVLVLGLLFTAVLIRAWATASFCFEGSISAYYFTSVRAVFVGALCTLGTLLIVYRGNTDPEDIALNVSGALAFVVAFVPTSAPKDGNVTCSASNVPTTSQIEAAVNNNLGALLIVGFAAVVLAIVLVWRSESLGAAPLGALVAFAVVIALAGIALVIWPTGLRDNAHATTAFLTFAGILAVVAFNSRGAGEQAEQGESRFARYRDIYRDIAVLMVATLVVVVGAHLLVESWRHWVLYLEALLLLEFLAFWIVQTVELWNVAQRGDEPITAETTPAPAKAPPPAS